MKQFLDDNFLLQNSTAERLFHEFAKHQPIIDYHNHLSPEEIATDKNFSTITEIWLNGDHYKWRAMRANGVKEKYITGDSNDKEKFLKWAETVPYTMRNPLYHWTHLELQRYFGITELLAKNTASSIYEQTNEQLARSDFSVNGLLEKMKVEVVCTTDHPTDSLEFHQMHQDSQSKLKMLPTFRPDKLIVIDQDDFLPFLYKLEHLIGSPISTYDELMAALENRIEFFHSQGCQLADHGLSQLYDVNFKGKDLDHILQKRKTNTAISANETQMFLMACLYALAKIYFKKGWTMQFHLGALRNNNQRLLNLVGADVGCDSIGDFEQARGLSAFLNKLDAEGKLTKTILYNLNPRDNELFATMMGKFNGVQLGGF